MTSHGKEHLMLNLTNSKRVNPPSEAMGSRVRQGTQWLRLKLFYKWNLVLPRKMLSRALHRTKMSVKPL